MLFSKVKKRLFFWQWQVENWAGLFSFLGSILASCAVDWQSTLATAIFLLAGAVFNYKGEDYKYYSLGYTFVAFGDIILSFSSITDQNSAAKFSLYLFAFLAFIGGLRYPLTKKIEFLKLNSKNQFNTDKIQKGLNVLPSVVGILNVAFKIPAIWLSLFAGEHENTLMAVCYALWMIADFLLSRMWTII